MLILLSRSDLKPEYQDVALTDITPDMVLEDEPTCIFLDGDKALRWTEDEPHAVASIRTGDLELEAWNRSDDKGGYLDMNSGPVRLLKKRLKGYVRIFEDGPNIVLF